jgi:hypothetical protein
LRCIRVSSLMSIKQRVLKILSGQYIPMSSLTFEHQNQQGQLLITFYQCTKFDVHKPKDYQNIERSEISYDQFDLWCINLKTHKAYQFFKMHSAPRLMSVKERDLKILSGQTSIFICPFWPLIVGPQNHCGHLLLKFWSLSSKGLSWYWLVSLLLIPVWPLTFSPQHQ